MDSVYVVLPNGDKKEANVSQTVGDVIRACVDTADYEDYALVFLGRKLQPGQQLADIEHLNATRPLRLIRQKNNRKPTCSKEEIDRLLTDCRYRYRTLIEEAHPQVSAESYQMLLTYINENDGENYKKLFTDFPNLLHDQLAVNAVSDFRLLIQKILKDDKFLHEHPECLQIFKKVLDAVYAKFAPSTSSVPFQFPHLTASSSIPATGETDGTAQPVITQQMLTEAMTMAFGGGQQQVAAATPAPSLQQQGIGGTQEASTAMHATYASQLQQMHEFGFVDDSENIQALMLTNGDVEQALQIVIAMRE